LARRADLARKTEQAKRDADLKRRADQARREAQAKAATASSAATAPPPQSTAPLGAQTTSTQPRPGLEAGNTIAGGDIAMAERPSAPAVAAIAPGIPVAPHAVLVSSPDHSVYWSLLSSGLIYRSNDRKSWTPQSTGVQAELLAGTAPSGTVCWAVGRNGVILLTEDGVHLSGSNRLPPLTSSGSPLPARTSRPSSPRAAQITALSTAAATGSRPTEPPFADSAPSPAA